MRNYFLLISAVLLLTACKKETAVPANENVVVATDSTHLDSAKAKATLKVEPLSATVAPNQVVFFQNHQAILNFDTEANAGKIKINGQDYFLDTLTFSDDSYEISGENIEIQAEEGDFGEKAEKCLRGSFPTITVKLNGQQTEVHNVQVEDCATYN